MREIYKVSINNSEYWDIKYDKNSRCFEKTNKPCHIYVEKTTPFIDDHMICNYKDASGIKYLWNTSQLGTRINENRDFVIEPSGIRIPKHDISLVNDEDEIKENPGIDISTITRTTYFCNLASTLTRTGNSRIDYDVVKEYRDNLLNQTGYIYNQSFLTPFEFALLFVNGCLINGIKSFNYYKLLSDIVEKYSKKTIYLPLLWNIDCEVGEHDYRSKRLFNAFALLNYIGVIYPDYDSTDQYEKIRIYEFANSFCYLFADKDNYLRLMQNLLEEHFELNKRYEEVTFSKYV